MSVLDIYGCGEPFKRKKMNYARAYRSWYALLSDKVLNLFTWEGLPFPQHELEIRTQLINNGYCGVVRSKKYNRLIVANGSGVGVTEYPDQWLTFVWAVAGDSGQRKLANLKGSQEKGISTIGADCVLIKNNDLMQPTRLLVERYAHLLAHAELSLQAILINSRATGIIAARDDKQRDDIHKFYDFLEDGKTMAIVDDNGLDSLVGSEGLRAISTAYPSSTHILDFWQIRQNLYKEFLTEIGISKSTDKRERLITSEVEQDIPLYGYSLDDMLKCRKEAAEQMNDIFNLTVSVKINPIIDQNVNPDLAPADKGGADNGNTGEPI